MAQDPLEKANKIIKVVLLAGIAATIIPLIIWELFVQKGRDPGVWSAIIVLIGIVLVGPAGITIKRSNGNGNGNDKS